jgi:hypothetical protein
MGIATNSHMCGTAVTGTDPSASVLDSSCRSHDVSNLFVVDSSFFPSSAALNPALTIAANAYASHPQSPQRSVTYPDFPCPLPFPDFPLLSSSALGCGSADVSPCGPRESEFSDSMWGLNASLVLTLGGSAG